MLGNRLIGLFVIAIAFAQIAASPQAAVLKELGLPLSRYSNNVLEDAYMDAPDLIRKYGYPLEIHEVISEDGYILQMFRIPHGRDANNDPNVDRPAVLVQHGLFCSAADWINMGPGSSLGYLLAEEGYDVWLGNIRGNYYSRKHVTLNPDSWWNPKFWEYSWEEMGIYDIPAMIDRILEVTGKSKIHYVGHSQGTTVFFVMASMRPEYNDKIISMHALAPVAYMENVQSLLLRFLAGYAHDINLAASVIGMNEFLPNMDIMTWAGASFCYDEVVTQILCTNILFVAGGRNEDQLNQTMIPVILGHTPAGASSRQLVHYAQGINDKDFRRYDHGWIRNMVKYGSRNPPKFPLEKISAPLFFHYSDNDYLAEPRDVDKLFRAIPSVVGKFRVNLASFTHVDFMWAIDAQTLVWDRMVNLMKAMDNDVPKEQLKHYE